MPSFTTDDGARINYELEGEGPPLLFVHGWCSNLRHWEPQARHFAARHRVLRVDRRGYGQSPVPAGYAFDREREVADLAQLATSVGVRDAVVVGHAGGGPTAMALAAERPDLVRALVCEEFGPFPPDPGGSAMVSGLLQQLDGPGYRGAMTAIYPGFFHPDTGRELVSAYASDAAATHPEVATGYLRAMTTMAPTPGAALPMPVLFVWAEQALRPASADDLRELVPQSQFVQVPASGHFVHLDAPEAFNREIDRFVDSLGS